jgi:acetolactate synthase-1/2/3 large subunit
MARLEGSDIIGETLKTANVKYVFGLVGHGNLGIIQGIDKAGIELISCHHETVAGMAADGYFRVTHQPGVVCLTCAPGCLNAQLAIAQAGQDHSAVVYLVGDIPAMCSGKGAYEEVDLNNPDDQFNLLRPMFKKAWKVNRLELLSGYIANAFNVAQSGCPGPVLIDIPFDLQTEEAETQIADVKKRCASLRFEGATSLVDQAADLLIGSKSLVLLSGGGVNLSDASDEMIELSQLLDAPIVTSIEGACSFSGSHPSVAGFIGSYGVEGANTLVRGADLILAVGTRFEEEETAIWLDGEVFKVPPTRLIQIDIDPHVIGKNYPVELGIVGDAKITLKKINNAVAGRLAGKKLQRGRVEKCQREKREWLEKLAPDMKSEEVPINPRRILKALEERFPDNGILMVDPSWARIGLLQQLFTPGNRKCHIVSGLLPIGWSTAAALGAATAKPKSKIIALTGDGGFLMGIQSIFTGVEYGFLITWIVINNNGYNALHVLQRAYFDRSVGSRFEKKKTGESFAPDYSAIAKGFGASGEKVEKPEQIEGAIERALSSGEPYILDFVSSGDKSRLERTRPVTWDHFWGKRREKKRVKS